MLDVSGLAVEFDTARGTIRPVDGVSWSVGAGKIVALVGESGCGKSVTALSILRLLGRPAGRIVAGKVLFQGRDLLSLSESDMRALRGRDISMIFQEPMTSLNPVLTIGEQIAEPLRIHLGMSATAARERARELLQKVGIGDAEQRLDQYPHHLSGGMRQRVMIAIGIACEPKLIIADEPTTALDVTIQSQILELMRDLARELGISLVLITHNLGVVARYVDEVNVMYAGRIVESGPVDDIFTRPHHPYTIGLLRSVPRLDLPRTRRLATIEGAPPSLSNLPQGCRFAPRCSFRTSRCDEDPLLRKRAGNRRVACHYVDDIESGALAPATPAAGISRPGIAASEIILSVKGLQKHFDVGNGRLVRSVQDVSFDIHAGETVGLVGESGCGKTTVGRTVLRLTEPTAGRIQFRDRDLGAAGGRELRELRQRMQVVFQDPMSSLNPRMSIGQTLAEPIRVYGLANGRQAVKRRVDELLDQVGLLPEMAERFPHQLSGGQRQRVGIARALAMEPEFIVLDEPVSALDVSIQGQIVNLLEALQARLGVSYLFIAHDLAVVRHISHRVIVMYLGRVMEIADRDALYATPLHPYTRALLDASPIPDPAAERRRPRKTLAGELPSPLAIPEGCVFRTRCPMASEDCRKTVPPLRTVDATRSVACIKV